MLVGVGWSEDGGGKRGTGWKGEKKGGGQSEGARGCGDPSNVLGELSCSRLRPACHY